MTEFERLMLGVIVVVCVFGGVWIGSTTMIQSVYYECYKTGFVKYDSWVLAKPLEFECKIHENEKRLGD